MSVLISNFQAPKNIDELVFYYEEYGRTNIDTLLQDAEESHETIWTVPSYAGYGDTVIFTCARTAKDHMGHVCMQAKSEDAEIIQFAEEQRTRYKKYSGKLIAIGRIGETPWPNNSFGQNTYSAKIIDIELFDELIDVSEFKGSIRLNNYSAHTKLNGWQWELIKRRIKK